MHKKQDFRHIFPHWWLCWVSVAGGVSSVLLSTSWQVVVEVAVVLNFNQHHFYHNIIDQHPNLLLFLLLGWGQTRSWSDSLNHVVVQSGISGSADTYIHLSKMIFYLLGWWMVLNKNVFLLSLKQTRLTPSLSSPTWVIFRQLNYIHKELCNYNVG